MPNQIRITVELTKNFLSDLGILLSVIHFLTHFKNPIVSSPLAFRIFPS